MHDSYRAIAYSFDPDTNDDVIVEDNLVFMDTGEGIALDRQRGTRDTRWIGVLSYYDQVAASRVEYMEASQRYELEVSPQRQCVK